MLLCAKYGVKLKPNMFSDSDSTYCKTELDDKEKLNILQLNLNLEIIVLLMIISILMHHVITDFKI